MKNALSSLQKDVSNIKSNVGDVSLTAGGVDIQNAYNFGVFGLSLGAAGVILAIIAMASKKIKKKKKKSLSRFLAYS